jgi:hypothetical protein
MLNQPVQLPVQPPVPGGGGPPPAPPPQQGQPLLQPPAPIATGGNYRSYFLDASKDPYNGKYTVMMSEFDVDVVVPPPYTPNQLGTRVYQAGDQDMNMAFVMHCRAAGAAATDPGSVTLYHRVARFAPRMGLPTTPWDDVAFAFQGDVTQGQAPPSIV